jgi:feruloyl-CoA synthase
VLGEVEVLFCAAAALRPELRARWSALAERVRGRPVRTAAGWGATETAPAATLTTDALPHAASVGVPVPGCVLRLHPTPSGFELRARGPNVTPGYWGAAHDAGAGFDADGFWCSGDTAEWVDPSDPSAGLRITGRLVEDFKLSSGTWVAAERVREDALQRLGALAEQVVVLAPDRDDLRLLVFPSAEGVAAGTDAVQAHCDAVLRAWRTAERGSSRVPVCGLVVGTPLDAATGEVTAKGSVNQRVVREQRAALIDEVYARAMP